MNEINEDIVKLFNILKEEGYVMVYRDNLANRFKDFLNYIEFPYNLNQDRDLELCPERNRFERQ